MYPRDRVDVGDLSIAFEDGRTITFGINQLEIDRSPQRERSDMFLAAVRTGARL